MDIYTFKQMLQDNKIDDPHMYLDRSYRAGYRIALLEHGLCIEELLKSEEPLIIAELINRGLGTDNYEQWKSHPNATVRKALAEKGLYLETLIKDKKSTVRLFVYAHNPEYFDQHPEDFKYLTNRKEEYVEMYHMLTYQSIKVKNMEHLKMFAQAPLPNGVCDFYQRVIQIKIDSEEMEPTPLTMTMSIKQLYTSNIALWAKGLHMRDIADILKTQNANNDDINGFCQIYERVINNGRYTKRY